MHKIIGFQAVIVSADKILAITEINTKISENSVKFIKIPIIFKLQTPITLFTTALKF